MKIEFKYSKKEDIDMIDFWSTLLFTISIFIYVIGISILIKQVIFMTMLLVNLLFVYLSASFLSKISIKRLK